VSCSACLFARCTDGGTSVQGHELYALESTCGTDSLKSRSTSISAVISKINPGRRCQGPMTASNEVPRTPRASRQQGATYADES
jgi:hypothetical protein